MSILGAPYDRKYSPSHTIRQKIVGYFSTMLPSKSRKTINSALPKIMPAWGRVRISNGGDSIRCAKIRSTGRDSSYVRVSLDSTRMTIEFISFFFCNSIPSQSRRLLVNGSEKSFMDAWRISSSAPYLTPISGDLNSEVQHVSLRS